MLRGALGAGRPATSYVSQLLLTYPAERTAMVELLQQTLGNGFVRSVIDATPELAGPGTEPNNRRNMLNYADEIAIHAELDGKAVDFVLEVK